MGERLTGRSAFYQNGTTAWALEDPPHSRRFADPPEDGKSQPTGVYSVVFPCKFTLHIVKNPDRPTPIAGGCIPMSMAVCGVVRMRPVNGWSIGQWEEVSATRSSPPHSPALHPTPHGLQLPRI